MESTITQNFSSPPGLISLLKLTFENLTTKTNASTHSINIIILMLAILGKLRLVLLLSTGQRENIGEVFSLKAVILMNIWRINDLVVLISVDLQPPIRNKLSNVQWTLFQKSPHGL